MSKSFIDRLAEHIISKYNLKKESLTIVFPNKRAAFFLRSKFREAVKENIWLPQMISIQEAMTQWSGLTLANETDILFDLIDIDAQLHNDKQKNGEDLRIFGSQALQMAKDFDEIDQYDVCAKDLFSLNFNEKQLQYWNFDIKDRPKKEEKYLLFFKSLNEYYDKLRSTLSNEKKGYYGMITKHLAHLDDATFLKSIGERKIIFAGFNALTRTEELIIDKLVKNGKAEIIFDYDSYYVNDMNQEAGLFARRYLERHKEWMENGISDRLSSEEKNIHIIASSGNTIQTKALQNNLHKLQQKDTSIILADENLLIPVLNSIPNQMAYSELKVSMGYPLKQTPIIQLLNNYFILQQGKKISRKITIQGEEKTIEGHHFWKIMNLMDLEIIKIVFEKDELKAFEKWKAEKAKQGVFIFTKDHLDDFDKLHDLKTFLSIILQENTTSAQLINSIKELLSLLAEKIMTRQKNNELLFLLNQISEVGKIINRLALLIEQHSEYANSLSDLEFLFKLISRDCSIRLNSSATDGLQIMGLLETRNLDFNSIHVLSVNEGILPADKSQSSFIPYSVKSAFSLPGYLEKQAVFAYHFYHLLQSAKEIYLYYNDTGNTSGGEQSRYIMQLVNEMAKSHANIHITEKPFTGQVAVAGKMQPLQAQKTDEVIEAIKNIFDSKNGLSPTSISSYIKCPFLFYLRYIERIKDNKIEEETGANIIGSIIHRVLEDLLGAYNPKEDGNLQIIDQKLFTDAIKPKAKKALQEAIENILKGGLSDIGYNYLDKIKLNKWLETYLTWMGKSLEKSSLCMIGTESELRHTITYDGVQSATFKGFADRIDNYNGINRIIDYKSGKVETKDVKVPKHTAETDNFEFLTSIPEKALQLLLYKYLFLKNNKGIAAENTTSAIHSFRHPKHIEFSLSVETSDKFLSDATFIKDMESLLSALVEDMLNKDKPFVQCEEKSHVCSYCDFAAICKRDQ